MVPEDDSRISLLPKSFHLRRSDDGEHIEVLIESNGLIEPCNAEKSPRQSVRVFHRLKQKLIKQVGNWSNKHQTERSKSEMKNFLSSSQPIAKKATYSSYDERNILDILNDIPFDEDPHNETLSTVSSILSSASNQKSQRRLLAHWRHCMSSSIRKIIKREIEDEMKGNPPKYRDLGLYIYPDDTIYSPKPEKNHSLLFLPTLETPPGSRDEESNAGHCSNGDDFPLKSKDQVVAEELFEDPDYDHALLHPSRSNLFVSFDDEVAQLIFQAASSDTEEFQPVQVDSVGSDIDASDMEEDSDRDEPFLAYFHAKRDRFDRPDDAIIRKCHSSETEQSKGSIRPLGVASSHPNWHGIQRQERLEEEQRRVWSAVEAPLLDGEVTDPPSPTRIETSRDEFWCLGQTSSSESDLTMTDILLNRHGAFPSDYLALPNKPRVKSLLEKYPFDEEFKDERVRACHFRRRPDQEVSASLATLLERGSVAAFAASSQGTQQQESSQKWIHNERESCSCLKCSSKSIYEDLLGRDGESLEY
mmetsp:Transcript_15077/g.22994  ORF Transcript_15077/g.22994 Transcript_15077/m.22994 type:complete len:531 (+) Transcript_15077:150-1742(+)